MKQPNLVTALVAIAMAMSAGLACSSLTEKLSNDTTKSNTAPASNTATTKPDDAKKSDDTGGKTIDPSKIEKADFTTTSEELDKEFNKKGVTNKELEKYSNKNIAVSGRVTMLVTEKNGTTQPWVTLFAPGLGNGVSCYFDDDNVGQMKMLKMDKNVKVQGFQDDFIVPEISPMLKHCVVLEGAN